MDLSAKMLQWLTQQGFHAVRAGNTALFPRLKSYLVAVGPGKTETKRTLISTYLGADGEGNRYFGRLLSTELTLEVFSAQAQGAALCEEKAEALLRAVQRDGTPFHCTGIAAGQTSYDAKADCFRKTVTVTGDVWMYYASEEAGT